MSLRTVASKDLRNVRRSRSVWIAAAALALLASVVAYAYEGYQLSPSETVLEMLRTLSWVLAMLLPIVAIVASYLSIAGERETGGIKFLLSVPNTRRDVFLGKLAARLTVVTAGVCFVFLAAAAVTVARHGTLPILAVLGVLLASLLYSAVFVNVAVALSAAVAARSRAIAVSVGAYFALILLYVVPGVRVTAIVRWLHHRMLGFERNLDLYNAVTYTSPLIAFRKVTNLALPTEFQQRVFRRSSEEAGKLPVYLSDEFSLVVFAVWLVIPLVLGYRRFQGADLL